MAIESSHAAQLRQLIKLWHEKKPRRAMGGWWALTGFSFQMSHFLFRFFKQLNSGGASPGQLAVTEQLSDILSPADDQFLLIQVKRTLTPGTLKSALGEAYSITELCLKHVEDLLTYLRFQIICRHLDTPLQPGDIDFKDAAPKEAREDCWLKMLAQFDANEPIIEEADPIGRLHVYLWQKGVRNTAGLIDCERSWLVTIKLAIHRTKNNDTHF